jgi:hypothetical protein
MRISVATVSALALSFASPAAADAVYWGCGFAPTTLSAGPLTCRQTVTCHDKLLVCTKGDRKIFEADAFADRIAVASKGEYVLGLSNRGGKFLYWLRNFRGETIPIAPVRPVEFCTMSVSNIREWFNVNSPDVEFQFDGDRLATIVVNGCNGRAVDFTVGQ